MHRTYSHLLYHVVFATKQRLPLIPASIEPALHAYIGGILRHHAARLYAAGGMPDHVHLLVGLRPVHSVAEIVKHVKGSSSRWLSEQRSEEVPFTWQKGYGVFTVSASQFETVRRYILRQREHHRDVTFESEWSRLSSKSTSHPSPRLADRKARRHPIQQAHTVQNQPLGGARL